MTFLLPGRKSVFSAHRTDISIAPDHSVTNLGEPSLGVLECLKRPKEIVISTQKAFHLHWSQGLPTVFALPGERSHLHQGLGEQLEALKQEWEKNLLLAIEGSGRQCPPSGLLEKSGPGTRDNRLRNWISQNVVTSCGGHVAFRLPPFLGVIMHTHPPPTLGVLVGHLSITELPSVHPSKQSLSPLCVPLDFPVVEPNISFPHYSKIECSCEGLHKPKQHNRKKQLPLIYVFSPFAAIEKFNYSPVLRRELHTLTSS